MRRALGTTIALLLLSSCSVDSGTDQETTRKTTALTQGVVYSQFNEFHSERARGGDLYGETVAFYNDTIVVGAPGENAIYVYRRQGNKRVFYEAQKITGLDENAGFGSSVAIADDRTIFAGAPKANVGDARSGRVRVFDFNSSTLRWEEAPDLRMMSPQYEAEFGSVIAAQGDRVVVGAPAQRRGTDSGSVHTFRKSLAGTWEFEDMIVADDREFGRSVALHEDRVAIGALGRRGEGPSLVLEGVAYVYEWTTPTGWQSTADITGADRFGESFGASVALEGDTLAVGVGDNNGHVYVFERNDGGVNAWGEVAQFDGAVGSDFGQNLDISQGTLVVPSRVADRAVYMFADDGQGAWEEVGKIDGVGDGFDYNFASVVAIDGTTVVAAEPDRIDTSDPNSPLLPGTVFVFDTNRAPTVSDAEVAVAEDSETEFSFVASDPDETDVLSMDIPEPQNGTIRGAYPRLRYRPNPDFFGKDEVRIEVVDQGGLAKVALVTFEITPVNDAPRAEDQFEEAGPEHADLVLKATDPEGDEISFEVVERPLHGELSGILPTLRYVPDEGFSGLDSFKFKATDGELWSEPVEFAIFVSETKADDVSSDPKGRLPATGGSTLDDDGCMAAGPGTVSPLAFLLIGFFWRRRS